MKKLSSLLDHMPPKGIGIVTEKAKKMEQEGASDMIYMTSGRPDFDTPDYIKEACIQSLRSGNTSYTPTQGQLNLRTAIAGNLAKEYQLSYTADEIVVTSGLSEAVYDVLNALVEEGDEVLLPDPCWPSYNGICHMLKAGIVEYSLQADNDFQLSTEELEQRITAKTKVLVLITPHNPTGTVLTRETLEKIAALAQKYDFYVVADEIYNRILYDDLEAPSIAALPGMKERTLTLNGFSKIYSMTGWRVGYVASSPALIEAVTAIHSYGSSCLPGFIQDACVTALQEEDESIAHMQAEYKKRRDYVFQAINEIDGLSCPKPTGAFYAWIDIQALHLSAQEASDFFMKNAHVALVPGNVFGSACGNTYLRMSYAASLDIIKEACRRMKAAVEAR
ncbi:pyridoxal phosphate-dependent aminotransferase [Megasphaera paucivorans]|uniref:Aminotransferase n=1 Tax=Megasphaera paucivorans TaxID=349095 RepID=A0A1G9SEP7_9FIRM|nr:pyridoxal phosphate-dependent aminotransferase [Megasphaera paucivorans]SDM33953.1 aminotransferase [Megasphaera paucivorans]